MAHLTGAGPAGQRRTGHLAAGVVPDGRRAVVVRPQATVAVVVEAVRTPVGGEGRTANVRTLQSI